MEIARTTTSASALAVESERHEIPSTMSAAVYRGVNDVRLEEVPVPEIGPGEILVRVHTCGICGTDLKKIATGSHSAPRIFGHETSGLVAKVGQGVRQFSVGDPLDYKGKRLQRDRDDFRLTGKRISQLLILRSLSSLDRDQSAHHTFELLYRCRELLIQYSPVGDNDDLLEYLLVVGVVQNRQSVSKPSDGVGLS